MLLDFPQASDGKLMKLDLDNGLYSVIEPKQPYISRGSAIEVVLKNEKVKCLVSLYADEGNLILQLNKTKFNLAESNLSASIVINSLSNELALFKNSEKILDFKYKYDYRDEDLLEDVVEMLEDRFRQLRISHLIKFYNSNTKKERELVDIQNTEELKTLKSEYLSSLPWLQRLKKKITG